MKRIGIIIIVLMCSAQAFAGGGWTYQKGKGFVKISQSAIYADQFYTPDGSKEQITTIGYYATTLYGEYGLTDRFTVIANIPFFARNTLNEIEFRQSGNVTPGDDLNSFGDMDLALQYGFLKGDKWVASARILFGLPTGVDSGGDTEILQTGDGEFNQMLRLDLSRGFAKSSWFSVYAGFNNRTQGFSDDYRYGAEVGTKLWEKFFAIAKLDIIQSTENGDVEPSESGTLFSNNMEVISPAIELAYQTEKEWGVSVGVAGAFEGQNILAAPNYSFGVYRKF